MRGEDTLITPLLRRRRGSPPHARGRPARRAGAFLGRWITPACAGKTFPLMPIATTPRDHPRMRGEDDEQGMLADVKGGSPPHARGRPGTRLGTSFPGRITPACAGKTLSGSLGTLALRDHPRMRGEDAIVSETRS